MPAIVCCLPLVSTRVPDTSPLATQGHAKRHTGRSLDTYDTMLLESDYVVTTRPYSWCYSDLCHMLRLSFYCRTQDTGYRIPLHHVLSTVHTVNTAPLQNLV